MPDITSAHDRLLDGSGTLEDLSVYRGWCVQIVMNGARAESSVLREQFIRDAIVRCNIKEDTCPTTETTGSA